MERRFLTLGALSAFIAVAAGAFGAHALRARLDPGMLAAFETGARYQMYHALALIGLGLSATPQNRKWIRVAGICLLLGIAGFSGGLYAYTLGNLRWVGMSIVPLGGMISIAGWILFAIAAWRRQDVPS